MSETMLSITTDSEINMTSETLHQAFGDVIAAVNTIAHGELKGHVTLEATDIPSSTETGNDLQLDQKCWTVVTFNNVNRRQMLNIASVYDWICNEIYHITFNTASDKNFVRWYLDDSFTFKKPEPPPAPKKVKVKISEIFGPTIQGEGCLVGMPTIFVRTAGCDYRCRWCDTKYAVDCEKENWKDMTCEEIFKEIKKLSNKPILITLSGGNPALFDFSELIDMGHAENYTFAVETQGSIYPEWFNYVDYITVSPKPPSSGMETDFDKLDKCLKGPQVPKIILKVVVGSDGDYEYAKKIFNKYPEFEHYITPCNANPGKPNLEQIYNQTKYIAQKMVEDGLYNVAIVPQLHVLLWQNQRGV